MSRIIVVNEYGIVITQKDGFIEIEGGLVTEKGIDKVVDTGLVIEKPENVLCQLVAEGVVQFLESGDKILYSVLVEPKCQISFTYCDHAVSILQKDEHEEPKGETVPQSIQYLVSVFLEPEANWN